MFFRLSPNVFINNTQHAATSLMPSFHPVLKPSHSYSGVAHSTVHFVDLHIPRQNHTHKLLCVYIYIYTCSVQGYISLLYKNVKSLPSFHLYRFYAFPAESYSRLVLNQQTTLHSFINYTSLATHIQVLKNVTYG